MLLDNAAELIVLELRDVQQRVDRLEEISQEVVLVGRRGAGSCRRAGRRIGQLRLQQPARGIVGERRNVSQLVNRRRNVPGAIVTNALDRSVRVNRLDQPVAVVVDESRGAAQLIGLGDAVAKRVVLVAGLFPVRIDLSEVWGRARKNTRRRPKNPLALAITLSGFSIYGGGVLGRGAGARAPLLAWLERASAQREPRPTLGSDWGGAGCQRTRE